MSGLSRTPGKRVQGNTLTGVRIPLSPPEHQVKALIIQGFFFWRCFRYASQYAIPHRLPLARPAPRRTPDGKSRSKKTSPPACLATHTRPGLTPDRCMTASIKPFPQLPDSPAHGSACCHDQSDRRSRCCQQPGRQDCSGRGGRQQTGCGCRTGQGDYGSSRAG